MADVSAPSKNQLRKAAKRLRVYISSDSEATGEELDQLTRDFDLLGAYRSTFEDPMLKVRVGMQSFVRTCGYPDAHVAQRLKRLPRVLRKLIQQPSMQITNMQDIAGVRAVLPDIESVHDVAAHIDKRWGPKGQIHRVYDYIDTSKASGYRAIHIVALRDERLVEIQLRTVRQQGWADGVESLSRLFPWEFKWDEGPEEILSYFALLADTLYMWDAGATPERSMLEELDDARGRANLTAQRIQEVLEEGDS